MLSSSSLETNVQYKTKTWRDYRCVGPNRIEKENENKKNVDAPYNTRVVPQVMSNLFLHSKWEQQTKESAVVDGTSCCVILKCFVTSIACITWPVSLLIKWPTTICRFASVLSSNSLWKRKSLLQKFTRDFSVLMEVCAWVRVVFEDGWNILKMGKRRQFRKQCVSVFGWLERSSTAGEFSNFQNAGGNVHKEVAIVWKK